jgi:putative transposase
MIRVHKVSQRQAAKAVSLPQSTLRYKPRNSRKDEEVIAALRALVEKHPAIGFWQCYYRLRRKGFCWNHKRIYRVYLAMKLNIRRRCKKRLPARVKQPLYQPDTVNQVWSIDYMSDSLWDGKKFRLLNIVDDYNGEVLHIEADSSLPTLRLIRILEYLKEFRGLPAVIRADNGPEFVSAQLDEWCRQHNILLAFIQPGKPMQNAYVERCNGNIRRELLNAYVFQSLTEVRERAEEWRVDYNSSRPHQSLGFVPPSEYKKPQIPIKTEI